MLEGVRARWALARARAWARRRDARPWHPDPRARRLLVVVPPGEEAGRAAWAFLARLDLPPEQLLAVQLGADVGAVAAPYMPRVRVFERPEAERAYRLPPKALRREAWGFEPDVALSLAPGLDLVAMALVGASPAAFRIGLATEGAEPFFELMVGAADVPAAVRQLEAVLDRLEPPVLQLGDGGTARRAGPGGTWRVV